MDSLAQKIVKAILDELNDRKGFDWWWDELDADIRNEIRDELTEIVEAHL